MNATKCDGVFSYFIVIGRIICPLSAYSNEFQTCGFGLYAVERKEDHAFMGYTGLHQIAFDVDFAPGIEIGWRLAHEYWGQGYAPEVATACLEYTRNKTDIKELFSFTSLLNQRSERVMQKIGMERVRNSIIRLSLVSIRCAGMCCITSNFKMLLTFLF
jgi:RimJ/RimL family protein N-acetyltransferase